MGYAVCQVKNRSKLQVKQRIERFRLGQTMRERGREREGERERDRERERERQRERERV